MKSFVGSRVIAHWDGNEKTGMVSQVKGTDIVITFAPGESVNAPLDDCEIYKASEEDLKQGIEYIVEW